MDFDVQLALAELDSSQKQPVTVLLVDDQAIIGEAVRKMLLDEPEVTFHFCSDPSKAIQVASEVKPTVILQDLVMPEVDGLTLLRYFRANESTKEVPMVVLSSKEEPIVKAKAFELGANDYLVKLPDKVELLARIRYHSAAYTTVQQRNAAYVTLEKQQKVMMEEIEEAEHYVRSLLPAPISGDISTEWEFIPCTGLGGDSFGYFWLDEDHLAMYLLDVCGHGVGAAFLSISAMNAINHTTLPDTDFYDPKSVLEALNNRFPMEEHNDKFFTIWYGVFNRKTREIHYSTAGHPPAILFHGPSKEVAKPVELRTPGMVIGGMPEMIYQSSSMTVEPYGRLYIFSDGIYEIERPDKSVLDIPDLIKLLQQPVPDGSTDIERIKVWAQKEQQAELFEDDFSIAVFQFN